MKTVLPGAAVGIFGGGENSRMLALAASRMGYRVRTYSSDSAPYSDLDRIREFAAGCEVVTVADGDVPVLALRAAAAASVLYPAPEVFEAVENGIGTKREADGDVLVEFTVIGARGVNGKSEFYAPIAIDRINGEVDLARSPAPIDSKLVKQAIQLALDAIEDLDLTGLACVEFSLNHERVLVIHELTPHPHCSGFLTVDACVTSQFDQQIRAVCGLPLGSTDLLRPAAMARLGRETAEDGRPDWIAAYSFPGVKVASGYLTATAASATRAKQIVRAARASLTGTTA